MERCPPSGAVRVYVCPVPETEAEVWPALLARLTEAERGRAARFVFARDRWGFAAAHGLLRAALAAAGVPADWEIAPDAHGKPRPVPPLGGLDFNISHTAGLVAVAIGRGVAVGVDAEPAGRTVDEAALRSLVLGAPEVAELDMFADRAGRLLRLWVAKECVVKALGLGFRLPVPAVVFRGDPPRLVGLPGGQGAAEAMWVRTGRLGGHWLGLACLPAPAGVTLVETSPAALAAGVVRGGLR